MFAQTCRVTTERSPICGSSGMFSNEIVGIQQVLFWSPCQTIDTGVCITVAPCNKKNRCVHRLSMCWTYCLPSPSMGFLVLFMSFSPSPMRYTWYLIFFRLDGPPPAAICFGTGMDAKIRRRVRGSTGVAAKRMCTECFVLGMSFQRLAPIFLARRQLRLAHPLTDSHLLNSSTHPLTQSFT